MRTNHWGERPDQWHPHDRALFDHSANAVYCLDLQGRFIDLNPAGQRLSGYTAEEGRRLSIRDLVITEDYDQAWQHFQEAAQGIPSIFECRITSKAGKRIDLEVTHFPMQHDDHVIGVYGIARDISNLKQAEAALHQSEARFRTVAQVTNDAIWDWDLTTDAIWWNGGYSNTFGYPSQPTHLNELLGNIHPEDRERVMCAIEAAIKNHATLWTDEYRYQRADGRYATVRDKGMILYDDEQRPIRMIGAMVDITERKQIEERLVYLAQKDPLTGLANRNLFYDHLNQAIPRARRHQQKLALIYLDLDRFKAINDALGHDMGDRLLKAVAQRLKDTLRDSDLIARIGGDEFTVILEEIDQAETVAWVGEKIIQAFSQPYQLNDRELFVNTSLGISLYPDDATQSDELIKKADAALYHAKAQGRNNFQFYQNAVKKACWCTLALSIKISVGKPLAFIKKYDICIL